MLRNALLGDQTGIAQRHDFFNGADKNEVVLAALGKAVAALTEEYGSEESESWCTALPQRVFLTKDYLGITQAGEGEEI